MGEERRGGRKRKEQKKNEYFENNVFIASAFSFSQSVGFKYLKTQKKIVNISNM